VRGARLARLVGIAALVPALCTCDRPSVAIEKGVAETTATSASALLDRVERHALAVAIEFRRDLQAEAEGTSAVESAPATETHRRWRMSMRLPGFAVRDRRTVLVSDLFVPPGAIASIRVTGRTGRAVQATLASFLRDAGGAVLTTTQDVDAEPVTFSGRPAPTADADLFAGSVAEGGAEMEAWVEPLGPARRRAFGRRGAVAFGRPETTAAGCLGTGSSRRLDLVLRADGTPLGFRFGQALDLDGSTWTSPAVEAEVARAVAISALREKATALAASSYVHAVRLAFRPADERRPAVLSFPSRPEEEETPDADTPRYGLAISPDLLLVPERLTDAAVRRLDRVRVDEPGHEPLDAVYEGRVRGYGAYVVRVPSASFAAVPARRLATPPRDRAFLVHTVAWRAGARRDRVDYERSLGPSRGYADRPWLTTEGTVAEGSWLLDLDGRVLGFAARLLPEDAEPAHADPSSAPDDGSRGVVAALFCDLGEPASLARDLDRRVLPEGGESAPRTPWLGVEYDTLTRESADALGISAPTRDGARGLVVNVVYPGSPAERAGVRVDDVLLSVKRTSGPGSDAPPVDLADAQGPAPWVDDSEVPRPWRPVSNALVRRLARFGVGATFDLELWRDGAARTTAVVVEAAPRDYATALASTDAATGLTVREMTYEVRAALRLAADAPGVVVSRVEEGGPAAQARLCGNELLREVDGKPLSSPADFAAALAAARAADRDTVRVVVWRLGRSRLVDLRLSSGGGTADDDR
jgi:hypothetical protein